MSSFVVMSYAAALVFIILFIILMYRWWIQENRVKNYSEQSGPIVGSTVPLPIGSSVPSTVPPPIGSTVPSTVPPPYSPPQNMINNHSMISSTPDPGVVSPSPSPPLSQGSTEFGPRVPFTTTPSATPPSTSTASVNSNTSDPNLSLKMNGSYGSEPTSNLEGNSIKPTNVIPENIISNSPIHTNGTTEIGQTEPRNDNQQIDSGIDDKESGQEEGHHHITQIDPDSLSPSPTSFLSPDILTAPPELSHPKLPTPEELFKSTIMHQQRQPQYHPPVPPGENGYDPVSGDEPTGPSFPSSVISSPTHLHSRSSSSIVFNRPPTPETAPPLQSHSTHFPSVESSQLLPGNKVISDSILSHGIPEQRGDNSKWTCPQCRNISDIRFIFCTECGLKRV